MYELIIPYPKTYLWWIARDRTNIKLHSISWSVECAHNVHSSATHHLYREVQIKILWLWYISTCRKERYMVRSEYMKEKITKLHVARRNYFFWLYFPSYGWAANFKEGILACKMNVSKELKESLFLIFLLRTLLNPVLRHEALLSKCPRNSLKEVAAPPYRYL